MQSAKRKAQSEHRGTRGVVAFSTILVLSAIVVEVGIAASLLVYFLNRSNYGIRLTNEAFAAARAGVDDAMIRVVRARFYPSCETTYNLAVSGTVSADVTIQNVACSSVAETQYIISSTGKALGKRRTLTATLDINPSTREVRVLNIAE